MNLIKILHNGVLHEYCNVSVHTTENIYFENGGFFPNTKAIVRIMTSDEIYAAPGDIMSTETGDFTVAGVRDNRRNTTIPHWKITARG